MLVPLLEANPELLPLTLFEYLHDNYPNQYDNTVLRTLQRRVKAWKVKHGPAKEVMFRQTKVHGRLGLSDFTLLKGLRLQYLGRYFAICYTTIALPLAAGRTPKSFAVVKAIPPCLQGFRMPYGAVVAHP